MEEVFLTPSEIAQKLNVSTYTVREWIKKGILPASKFPRAVRVSSSDLDKFILSRKVGKDN